MKGSLAVHCIRKKKLDIFKDTKTFDWNLYVLDILFFAKS